jgi:CRP/FNR family cyclic AMP-dependent transcriptional regulator
MPALLTEGTLKGHPFLEGASEQFLNELGEFSREASFEAGEAILTEGGYADKCFLIREGRVQLELRANGEPPVVLQTLGRGDILGWSWLYPPFLCHFTARAMEHCEMIELKAASLMIRAEENPVFGYELMKRISMQLIHRLEAFRDHLARFNEQNTRDNGQIPGAEEPAIASNLTSLEERSTGYENTDKMESVSSGNMGSFQRSRRV